MLLNAVPARFVEHSPIKVMAPWVPKTDRRGSCGFPTEVVQHPAKARATGDLAICPIVIRRSILLSDELATDALVKPLGPIVLNEFLDRVAQMSLAEDDEVIETLVFYRLHKPLSARSAM